MSATATLKNTGGSATELRSYDRQESNLGRPSFCEAAGRDPGGGPPSPDLVKQIVARVLRSLRFLPGEHLGVSRAGAACTERAPNAGSRAVADGQRQRSH